MEYSETLQMLQDLIKLLTKEQLIKVIQKCENAPHHDSQRHNLLIKAKYRYKELTGVDYEKYERL